MNLHHLHYFITLAHMEHFIQAASALNITQPALTYAINNLEEELGVALFEKKGRNVTLTRHGRQLLEEIEPAVEQLDHSFERMKLIGQGMEQLHIGFLPVLGVQYIPYLVSGFGKTEAGERVTFRYHSGLTLDLMQMLKGKTCDLVFSSYEAEHPELVFVPVVSQDLVVIVPKDHPLAGKDEIDLRETEPYPQIFFHRRAGLHAIVSQLFQKIHVTPRVVMEAEEDQVIAGFVAAGFGIAVVPEMSVLDHLPVKRLRIIRPDWQRNFYLVYPRDGVRTPALQAFLVYVQNQAEAHLPFDKIFL